MKKEERSRLVKVGIFLATTLVITMVIVFILGRTRSLFSDKIHIHAYFSNVNGLIVGAPVRLSGFEIGIVEGIRFTTNLSASEELCATAIFSSKKKNEHAHQPRVYVEMNIQKEFLQYIRKDSLAQLSSKGLLGDAVIDIVAGDMQREQVQNGSCLPSETPTSLTEVTELAEKTIGDVHTLVGNVNTLVENGSGLLKNTSNRLNDFLSEEMAKDVHRSIHSFANVMEGVERGPGVLHALLYDKQLSSDVRDILGTGRKTIMILKRSVVRLNRMLQQIESGPGTAHTLLYQDQAGPLLTDLSHTVKQVDDVLSEVRTGSGMIHSLLYEKDKQNLLENLNETAETLKKMVKDIDDGKGTIGGLVKDPSVYKSLKRIIKNAQGTIEDSKVLTWILQRLNKDNRPAECRADDM